MKTLAKIAVFSLVLGTAASSQAQGPRAFLNQFVKSAQGRAKSTLHVRHNQAKPKFNIRRAVQGRHFGGGFGPGGPGYVQPPGRPGFPNPRCGGGYYCPPRPPICHVYIVYYYDCHCGWKTYGTYYRYHDAQYAVQMLQDQGYRAYYRKTTR